MNLKVKIESNKIGINFFHQKGIKILPVLYFLRTGLCQDVTQFPATSWSYVSKSAEMNCSHNKDAGHSQMYWFRQRYGETMTLIVFTAYGANPDYGKSPEDKYSTVRENFKSGALTVKNVQPEDSAVYFCAVSKHSDGRSIRSCTKTACQ